MRPKLMFSCQCNLHGFHLRLYFAIVSVKLYPIKSDSLILGSELTKESRGVNVGVIKRGGIIVWHLSNLD